MKKKLFTKFFILVALLSFFLVSSYSQPFGGGIFAGGNFSQIDNDMYWGYNLPGFYGGGFINLTLAEKLTAQFEIAYIRKGAGNNFDETNTTFYKIKLDYIEMPILLSYSLHKRFRVHAGLAYGILFKSTEDLDGSGDLTPIPPFDNYDFSGLIGFDFRIFEKLCITSRLGYSILPVRPHPGNQTHFLNQGQYNNSINFSLRYQII